jgi:cell filamentation protein, protein adenylyltransferase
MNPFDPSPFPPLELHLEPVVALVGRANASLSRYDGLLESLVNPEVLLSPLLMKEAELSSRIEGTIATANEVYQQQAGEVFEPGKTADIQEIMNYRHTLRQADEVIKGRKFSLHLIRQMHEILMTGVRGANKNPGKFRDTQNWIGKKNSTIDEATYVPPPPLALNGLLETFINFVNAEHDDLDPTVQTALVHAQFELIHPFDDGNGRIGRLLIPLLLTKRRSLVSPSLYISGYLESNRDTYYECLRGISAQGDWLGWIRFFLGAMINQAESNLMLVRQIIDLYEAKKNQVGELLHSDQAIHIVDMLFDSPVFRATELHERLGIQRQRAAIYIRKLKEAGVIQELRPTRGRRSALLSFEDLWQITD